jgi:hypothetical protein
MVPRSPGGLRRRDLVRRGAGALALATLAPLERPLSALAATAPPLGGLRKMVVLGPAGTLYPGSTQDYRFYNNRQWTLQTGTRWIRLWADWPTLMPARGQFDAARLAALDAQIVQAKADGLKVMLTLFRFPTWANGVDAMSATQLAATMPDRRKASQTDDKAKTTLMRYPASVSASSDWGQFFRFLAGRYSVNNPSRPIPGATVDMLEIANEPNLTWWPQQAPSTTTDPYAQGGIVIHKVVARMLQTAGLIVANYGNRPLVAGPGTHDGDVVDRLQTHYGSFMNRVLDELTAIGFKGGPIFAWTHHNYTDVTYDQGVGTTAPDAATNSARSTNRAAAARAKLVGRWRGWPTNDPAKPGVYLTEGGVTLSNIASRYGITDPVAQRAKQADLIQRNWARMAPDTGEGAGIAGFAQYLFYTDPNYDCGLADTAESGGATRAAFDTWKALPSNQ